VKKQVSSPVESPQLSSSIAAVAAATPRPLVFVSEYTRESRPLSWRSVDLKIQNTLPLLGTDEISSGYLPVRDKTKVYGEEWKLVRVTLACKGYNDDGIVTAKNVHEELKILKGAADVTIVNGNRDSKQLETNHSDGVNQGEVKNDTKTENNKIEKKEEKDGLIRTRDLVDPNNDRQTNVDGADGNNSKGREDSHQPKMTPNELWDSLIQPFVHKSK